MSVRVEFYGIARKRAGVEFVDIDATSLGEVFDRLCDAMPEFAAACLLEGQLKSGFLANVNGRAFTTKRDTHLSENDAVLIVSADAGG